jgi:hypothetical protein
MGTPYIPPTFRPPTPEELAANPSYQFRLRGGQQAIDRSAAARGMLRTGGPLKDLAEYGQNFASQEYENAYDRALREYDLQRQNALDKWKSDWEQYVFAATPRGGGGGRGEDIPAPPPAPPGGPPDEPEPTVPSGRRNPHRYPPGDPRSDEY